MPHALLPAILRAAAEHFDLRGDFRHAVPHGSGHIHDTFAVTVHQAGTPVCYLLQRLNTHVFPQPALVMENIERVTAHLRNRLAATGVEDLSRRVLTLVPTREGRVLHVDDTGGCWRCYLFIEGARTYDQVESVPQAAAAARAFGEFQCWLADLPAPRLHVTIDGFHDGRRRFTALQRALRADPANRAAEVKSDIEFALAREAEVDVLLHAQAAGELPERVTHNDTKLNNVMLDDRTGEGVCVIDLDTAMPGLALHDFGDLCRSACRSSVEDERDLARVEARLDVFAGLARGYLDSTRGFLSPAERRLLVFSARLMTYTLGLRFLTDYLEGDHYFRIRRPGQNADRARAHFALLASFERHAEEMERIVEQAWAETQPANHPGTAADASLDRG